MQNKTFKKVGIMNHYKIMNIFLIRILFFITGFSCNTSLWANFHNQMEFENLSLIQDLYNADLCYSGSMYVKAAKEDGLRCVHWGFLFPWDNQSQTEQHLLHSDNVWQFIHRLELNSIYYGFLFLNNPSSTTHILDAGCGTGTTAILMHKTFNCFVTGYTLAENEILYATSMAKKHNCSHKLQFYQGNILNLPVQNNQYDVIWVSDTSEYIVSLLDLFKEFQRVGKNGTRLIIFATCAETSKGKKIIDEFPFTHVHTYRDYIRAGKKSHFKLSYCQNLNSWIIPYFNIRASANCSDFEKKLTKAFMSNDLKYYLFCFDIEK